MSHDGYGLTNGSASSSSATGTNTQSLYSTSSGAMKVAEDGFNQLSSSTKNPESADEDIWPPKRLGDSSFLTWFKEYDWASTPLGPTETWPKQLKKSCELMLSNPDPVTIFWGPDLILIYNEAYIELAGNKHPEMMGGSARVHWWEVWDQYDPFFDQMRIDGKALKQDNTQLLIQRNGFLEEGFFNLIVMPLFDDEGSVVGFYEPVTEVTKQNLAERRMHTLMKVGERTSLAVSLEDLWSRCVEALTSQMSDIHFLALYSLDHARLASGERQYTLKDPVGITQHVDGLRPNVNLDNDTEDRGLLPSLQKAAETRTPAILRLSDDTLSQSLLACLRAMGVDEELRTCVTYPLYSSGDDHVEAFLLVGINPKRPYDQDYRLWIDLLARQIESAMASVKLFEQEKERLRQQAFYQSEMKFKKFAENAQVGIFGFDSAGNMSLCNDAWVEISGHDIKETTAMSWEHDVHPDCMEEIRGYWNKLLTLPGPQTFEVQYRKPWQRNNGSDTISLDRTYALASAYTEIADDGTIAGIVGCVTDISGLKWLDRVQSQRLSEALELKRQQENFLDITSHEMRNPLNAILHCAAELTELLPELSASAATVSQAATLRECLSASQTIVYCGRHQKRIIDDVLTLSKLDSNLLGISPVETRPLEIVEEVLKVFDTEIRASSIKAKTELADSYTLMKIESLLVDSHRLIQILINLVANAIKFTKGESLRSLRIILSAYITEPTTLENGVPYVPTGRHRVDPTVQPEWGDGESVYLHFSVRDTGPGMSREEADLLFNRFVQGSPRTHVHHGGSGLGLFISRELAELHGGSIGISSELGLGSTFAFYVKCRRPTSAPTTMHVPVARSASLTSPGLIESPELSRSPAAENGPLGLSSALQVLIVEDNLVNQKILAKLVRKQGYGVSIANHGLEALNAIQNSLWRRRPPDPMPVAYEPSKLDIVLCDIEMPVMDGKEFVRQVRQQQEQGVLAGRIPIIAVTGNAREEQVRRARECGFDEVSTLR